jgi:hypothetical protein
MDESMPDIDTIERLFRSTAVLGLGFVFLAGFALISLYGLFYVVLHGVDILGAIKVGLPRWFSSQVSMHQSVQRSVDTQSDTMREMQITQREMQANQKEVHLALTETSKGVAELLSYARKRKDE